MDPRRFIPRLDLLEDRETPAIGLTPEQVFAAEGLAEFFYSGTRAALDDQAFIRQAANRAGTQALAGTIVAQSAALQDVLARYVVGLRDEQAAAAPAYAGYFDDLIGRFTEAANAARLAGVQAQQVSGLIDQFNAADAARAAGAGRTVTPGTTGTGTIGTGTTGIGTGTANPLPTNDDLNETTLGMTTSPGTTPTPGSTGTTGGTTSGTGTGSVTTGGTTTSATPTPTGTVPTAS